MRDQDWDSQVDYYYPDDNSSPASQTIEPTTFLGRTQSHTHPNIASPFSNGVVNMTITEPYEIVPASSHNSHQQDYSNYSQNGDMSSDPEQQYETPSHNTRFDLGHDDGRTPYLYLEDFESAVDVLRHITDYNTIFLDEVEAANHRAGIGRPEDQDETLPTTEEEKRACVKLLFKAFKSVAHAQDNLKMQQPFRDQRHGNRKVEAMCWDLLMAITRRCESGPLLLAYDETKAVHNQNMTTFAQRLDAVVTALTREKTICKHLLDAPYINTFVDDPKKAADRVRSNRELNKKKGIVMAKGKEILDSESPVKTPKRKRAKDHDEDESDFQASSAKYKSKSGRVYTNAKAIKTSPTPASGRKDRATGNGGQTANTSTSSSKSSSSSGTYNNSPVVQQPQPVRGNYTTNRSGNGYAAIRSPYAHGQTSAPRPMKSYAMPRNALGFGTNAGFTNQYHSASHQHNRFLQQHNGISNQQNDVYDVLSNHQGDWYETPMNGSNLFGQTLSHTRNGALEHQSTHYRSLSTVENSHQPAFNYDPQNPQPHNPRARRNADVGLLQQSIEDDEENTTHL